MLVLKDRDDGAIFVMAVDRGLAKPVMRTPEGRWRERALSVAEMAELVRLDKREAEDILAEALSHFTAHAGAGGAETHTEKKFAVG